MPVISRFAAHELARHPDALRQAQGKLRGGFA